MIKPVSLLFLLSFLPGWLQAQTGTPAVGDAGAAAADLPPFVTLWQVILSGGWVMIPLGILSVIAVTLVLVYFVSLRRGAVVSNRYMHTAETMLLKGDVSGLIAISNRHGEAVARVARRTLGFAQRNPHANFKLIREVAETEGTRQAGALNQRISYLADVGTIAPMVGLLGTVIGMIQAFTVLAEDAAASRPMLLAEGVSMALITTAAGLIIGIPALAFYAYFRGRVTKLIAELEAASTELLAMIAIYYDKVEQGESFTPIPASMAPAPPASGTRRRAPSTRARSVFDDDI